MSKNTELLGAAAVIVVLTGLLLASFIRHLRWEERRFMWHVRMAVHTTMFVAILAAGGYLYLHLHK